MNGKATKSAFLGRVLSGYTPRNLDHRFHPARRDGFFRAQLDVPAMLTDPTIQIGLEVIKAPFASVRWEVTSDSKDVQKFVDATLSRFWMNDLGKALRMFEWGTVAGECCYKLNEETGLVEYEGLEPVHVLDTLADMQGTRFLGFKVLSGGRHRQRFTPPKGFWLSYDPPIGRAFGRFRLESAWEPWMEKCGSRGALSTRRLWFFKSAFNGGIMWYPEGSSMVSDTEEKQNQDLAREIVEKAETGNVMAMPSTTSEEGKDLWRFQPSTVNGSATDLLQYPKDLDEEILRGMGVFPEIVKAAETGGGWSGRSVPFLVFLTRADNDVRTIINAVDTCIIRPGVTVNYGEKAKYQIKPISLVPKPPKKPGAGAGASGGSPQRIMGQASAGRPAPVRMSEAMVAPLASPLLTAQITRAGCVPLGDDVFDMFVPKFSPVQLAVTHAPKGGVDVQGQHFTGGEFIPSDVIAGATEAEKTAVQGGGDAAARHKDRVSKESQQEGNRLSVLGDRGKEVHIDPIATAPDEHIRQRWENNQPLPMPHHGDTEVEKRLGPAWETVSKLWPEMAGQVGKVRMATPEENKQIGHATAAIHSETGDLVIPHNSPSVPPEILWHELVHLEQIKRGVLGKSPHYDKDGMTDHGRHMESEAHQRGNMQAGELIDRLTKKNEPEKKPVEPDEPEAAGGWGSV